jgi:hypothetical protein
MKYQNLLLTLLAAMLTIDMVVLPDGSGRSARAESNSNSVDAQALDPMGETLVSGDFVASEHPTKGSVQIVMQNGKRYLKFDEEFQSDEGPDLFVLLHRQNSPKKYQRGDYVSLGRLQKVSGKQMYKIPAGVNIAKFKSVVIWCRKFNATFGFAPLS